MIMLLLFYPIRIPDHAADIHVSGSVFLPDITVLFILYFCKSSFNLSIFLRYFLVPRGWRPGSIPLKISRKP